MANDAEVAQAAAERNGWQAAEAATHRTMEELADQARRQLAAEMAGGWRHFTLLHGDPETQADVDRLARMRAVADGTGAVLATRGGGDWTCWILGGRNASTALLALDGAAHAHAASWWRWTTDGTQP